MERGVVVVVEVVVDDESGKMIVNKSDQCLGDGIDIEFVDVDFVVIVLLKYDHRTFINKIIDLRFRSDNHWWTSSKFS